MLKPGGNFIIGIVDKDSFLGEVYQSKNSIFYKAARLYSVQGVIDLLKKNNFKEIITSQTIFSLPENLKEVEPVRQGYGQGGFVVICGRKGEQS